MGGGVSAIGVGGISEMDVPVRATGQALELKIIRLKGCEEGKARNRRDCNGMNRNGGGSY